MFGGGGGGKERKGYLGQVDRYHSPNLPGRGGAGVRQYVQIYSQEEEAGNERGRGTEWVIRKE